MTDENDDLIKGLTASGFRVVHSNQEITIMRGDPAPSERRDHAEWLRRALERAEKIKQGWKPPADFSSVKRKVGYAPVTPRKRKVISKDQ